MSSHREAPGIAADPVADNTDLYAFVSPNKPSAVVVLPSFCWVAATKRRGVTVFIKQRDP
jgi:hypothetical protein